MIKFTLQTSNGSAQVLCDTVKKHLQTVQNEMFLKVTTVFGRLCDQY